jgi:hypothetical protein
MSSDDWKSRPSPRDSSRTRGDVEQADKFSNRLFIQPLTTVDNAYNFFASLVYSFYARTIKYKLHDSVDGLVTCTHSEEANNVLMIEPFHHFRLAKEIQLFLNRRTDFERLDGNSHLMMMKMII